MFWKIAINHTSFNRFYWCVYMLCMYICAISCWQWAVKWLLRTLLSIWVWISELNLAYCRGNVLIHWCHLYQWLSAAQQSRGRGSAGMVASNNTWEAQKHWQAKKRSQATQKLCLFPERKRFQHGFFSLLLFLF